MAQTLLPSRVVTFVLLLLACDLGRSQCLTAVTAFDGDTDNGFGHVTDIGGGIMAVGAPHDDVMGPYSGSVYVMDAITGQAHFKLTASNGKTMELFGYEVAIGQGLLAVGAPGVGGTWGPTHVYDLTTGNELSQLMPSLAAESFGYSLAVEAGMVVAGDYKAETAYVFDALTGVELFAVQDPSGVDGTMFGYAVAIAANRVAIGAGVHKNQFGGWGMVFIYDATTGQLLHELERDKNAPFFGWSLATTGTTLVVGSNETLNLYDLTTGAHLKEILVPSPSTIAVDGNQAIITDGWASRSYVVDLVKGKVKFTLEGVAPVSSLSIGSNRWVVSHSGGGFAEVAYQWDVEDADGDGFSNCKDVGSSYCGPANPNSTGSSAWIAAGGSKVVAEGDLRLRALSLPLHKTGYFLVSRTQGFIPFAGGSDGNLCLGGMIGRFSHKVRNSGSNGRFTMVVNLTAVPPGAQTVLPGEDWNFQAWYRDVNPNPTSNFTDAVNILFE